MHVIATSGLYQIRSAREEDIVWAAALGRRVYGGLDVIPTDTMLAWFRANPNGFFLFWHDEKRIGNFDLLPLKPTAMQHFACGQLLEKDITPDDLFPPMESHLIRDLHWESISIDPASTASRSRMMKLFASSYLQMLGRLCPVEQVRHTYAIAASQAGSRVLQRMGLAVIGEPAERLDAHPLYRGTVASYRAAMEQLGRR